MGGSPPCSMHSRVERRRGRTSAGHAQRESLCGKCLEAGGVTHFNVVIGRTHRLNRAPSLGLLLLR